jgi:predicted ATPase/DNA-binding SARP family transcriptional activator
VEFAILGPVEVLHLGTPVRVLGTKERLLVARLLIQPGAVVSTDALIDAVWRGEPPGNARNALHAVVTRLRRSLGPPARELLRARPPGYLLAVDRAQVDACRFEDLVAAGRQRLPEDPQAASALLDDALRLWRGSALQDLAEEEFARAEIDRLNALRMTAVEARIDAELALNRHTDVLAELTALVAEHPLREHLRSQLMLALYRSGRQADALEVYRQTRALLVEELGVEPGPELTTLYQQILRQDTAVAPRPMSVRARLPARITPFIGRTAELADLCAVLRRSRLVTVLGPGGSGKTSLALEAVRELVSNDTERWPDGAFFVDLAAVTDHGQVSSSVAAALGLRSGPGGAGTPTTAEQLIEAFTRDRALLLVLDNCEHLTNAVATLTDRILRAANDLTLLATSREPLGLIGEVTWSIPGMAIAEATRLFEQRAAAARPTFALDPESESVVAEICARLDGMPLAIELAAARLRALPVAEIAKRLDDRFALLTTGGRAGPARHQTLRATIDWSYQLLTEPERSLFARLSVFVGPWTLAAAEAVCADSTQPTGQILDLLTRLVDRSLVEPEPGPAARFRMLETIRQYADDQLQHRGELGYLRGRHAAYFLALAEEAGTHPESPTSWAALEQAQPDLHTALQWALTERADAVLLRFAAALGWYWATWHDRDGIAWMRAILDVVPPTPSLEYGRALRASAYVESYAPTTKTKVDAQRAVNLLDQFGDHTGAGRARLIWAFIELMLGAAPATIADLIDTAERTLAEPHDRWGMALAALSRFRLNLHTGALPAAVDAGQDALARFQTLGDPWGIPWTTLWLAIASRTLGDTTGAERLLHDALGSTDHLAYVLCYAHCELGGLAALRGDHAQARRHHETARQLAPTTGVRDSVAIADNAFGFAARLRDDATTAKASHEHALSVFTDLGSPTGIAHSLCCLGYAEIQLRRTVQAREHLTKALDIAHGTGRPDITTAAIEGLACTCAATNPQTASLLLGAGRAIRDTTNVRLALLEGHDPAAALKIVESMLGSAAAASVINKGTQPSVDDIVQLARSSISHLV